MLFLFNKAKIVSYLVTVFTIVALFAVAYNWKTADATLQVSVNTSIDNNSVQRLK